MVLVAAINRLRSVDGNVSSSLPIASRVFCSRAVNALRPAGVSEIGWRRPPSGWSDFSTSPRSENRFSVRLSWARST
ncbi:hypothetical protein D3C71_1883810 [compost metagenome]